MIIIGKTERLRRSTWAVVLLAVAFVLSQPCSVLAQTTVTTSGGTANQIPKWTGNFTLGDSLITQSTAGNIGIGTTNPSGRLHIDQGNTGIPMFYGSLNAAANTRIFEALQLNAGGSGDVTGSLFWTDNRGANPTWYSSNNGANPVVILANGNVGIGTTAPGAAKLAVAGGFYGADNAQGYTVKDSSGIYRWVAKAAAGNVVELGDNASWGGIAFLPGATEKMRITNAGNVGIGTTAPAKKLEVYGPHVGTEMRLKSSGDGGTNDATLNFWASEPLITYTGVGLGNNIVNYNGSTAFARVNTTLGGSYLRLLNNEMRLNVVSSSGVDTNAMAITSTGITVAGNIAAKYQDVAEWVPARRAIPAGTVVVLDPEESNHVLPSTRAYDTGVAGVVSGRPGVLLGEGGEGKVMVATTGRVKVKVDASAAAIRVGDLLVTSGEEGVAMRSQPLDLGGTPIHRPGTLIGKALEPFNNGRGEILVLLSLQ